MKNKLRKEAIEKRKNIACEKLNKKIIANLTEIKEYKESKNIICYYPLKGEADTRVLFDNQLKNWYLPRVNGIFLDICPCSCLQKGSFGIMEPQTEKIKNYSEINMVIIPACAVDRKGYRLGWGKGYYDRFLPLLPENCKKVVLIYSSLVYDTVFPEKFDVKADIIVTDTEILRI